MFTILMTVVIWLMSIGMVLFGYVTNDAGLAFTGVVFAVALPLFTTVSILMGGGIFRTTGTPFQLAASFEIGRLVTLIPFGGLQLSFAAPSQSGHILSSALADTDISVQTMINIVQAPFVENALMLSLSGLFYWSLGKLGMTNPWLKALLASTPVGLFFAGIHAANRSGGQFLILFLVMFIWSFALIAVDIGLVNAVVIPVTFLFTVGNHSGINISSIGGVGEYIRLLTTAPTPEIYLSIPYLGLEAVMLAVVIWGVYKRLDAILAWFGA
ncbi:hypothetical protein G3I44_14345 [Halogeometricum borinquense]|uniref:Uncharacterized protein n=1 Tax=Halogeometricum borinquense TaxID=60847 RepID=A0A6C0UIM1_9EURY|nr:hypothetical protein [Halogeometricum borinquense]QIB75366.1 hypothetical protein G3I44_14345 [Halogeometricum borinquense]